MKETPPQSTHTGELNIGGWQFICHVLGDKRRIITQFHFFEAIALEGKSRESIERLRKYFQHPLLAGPKSEAVFMALNQPVLFRQKNGVPSFGYIGELLVDYCQLIIRANQLKIFQSEAEKRAVFAAENIVLALAKTGIVALIDEATGYQEIRNKDELRALLDAYLNKELAAWAKRFPDEFYMELFRLKNWKWDGIGQNRPGVVGHYTNDIVYSRIAPGLLEELQRKNPLEDSGRRSAKHHQWLTNDIGHTALAQHLYAVIALMRASSSWSKFHDMLQRSLPRKGDNLLLDLDDDDQPPLSS
jgi:hypothetical protein